MTISILDGVFLSRRRHHHRTGSPGISSTLCALLNSLNYYLFMFVCFFSYLFPHNLLPFLAGIRQNCPIDCLISIYLILRTSRYYTGFSIVFWVLFFSYRMCLHSKQFRINNEIQKNNNKASDVDDWNLHMFENNNDKKKLKLTLIECVYVFLLLLLRCCCYDDVVDIRNTLCSFVANFARVRALSAA